MRRWRKAFWVGGVAALALRGYAAAPTGVSANFTIPPGGNLSDLLKQGGPMVEPLRAPEFFARVFVEMGAPTWPNGFDLDPINLYMNMRKSGDLRQVATARA